jgi:hypothetical protein
MIFRNFSFLGVGIFLGYVTPLLATYQREFLMNIQKRRRRNRRAIAAVTPTAGNLRETNCFTVGGDDGKLYRVRVLVSYISAPGPWGTLTHVESSRRFTTHTNEPVTRIAKGTYLIETTGVTLRTDDPAAP